MKKQNKKVKSAKSKPIKHKNNRTPIYLASGVLVFLILLLLKTENSLTGAVVVSSSDIVSAGKFVGWVISFAIAIIIALGFVLRIGQGGSK